jgi:hypothetical protein
MTTLARKLMKRKAEGLMEIKAEAAKREGTYHDESGNGVADQ